jgi:hypothetical protein
VRLLDALVLELARRRNSIFEVDDSYAAQAVLDNAKLGTGSGQKRPHANDRHPPGRLTILAHSENFRDMAPLDCVLFFPCDRFRVAEFIFGWPPFMEFSTVP